MKCRVLVILMVGFLVGADAPPDDIVQQELKTLEGEWQPVSVERAGKKLPSASFDDERVIIKGV